MESTRANPLPPELCTPEDAYAAIYIHLTEFVVNHLDMMLNPELGTSSPAAARIQARARIQSLPHPSSATDSDIADLMRTVICGDLEWTYKLQTNWGQIGEYAHAVYDLQTGFKYPSVVERLNYLTGTFPKPQTNEDALLIISLGYYLNAVSEDDESIRTSPRFKNVIASLKLAATATHLHSVYLEDIAATIELMEGQTQP